MRDLQKHFHWAESECSKLTNLMSRRWAPVRFFHLNSLSVPWRWLWWWWWRLTWCLPLLQCCPDDYWSTLSDILSNTQSVKCSKYSASHSNTDYSWHRWGKTNYLVTRIFATIIWNQEEMWKCIWIPLMSSSDDSPRQETRKQITASLHHFILPSLHLTIPPSPRCCCMSRTSEPPVTLRDLMNTWYEMDSFMVIFIITYNIQHRPPVLESCPVYNSSLQIQVFILESCKFYRSSVSIGSYRWNPKKESYEILGKIQAWPLYLSWFYRGRKSMLNCRSPESVHNATPLVLTIKQTHRTT